MKATDMSPSISAPAFLDLYDALVKQHVTIPEQSLGFTRAELLDIEKRIPVSMQTTLWNIAKNQGAPEHIGLIVGQQINEEAQGMMSHLLKCADDLKEVLYMYEKYMAAMSECIHVEIQEQPWGCRLLYKDIGGSGLCDVERALASLITWGQYLSIQPVKPMRVSFEHKRPSYFSEYIKLFGINTLFAQSATYIDLDTATLNTPVATANPYVKNILQGHLEKYVGDLYKSNSLCLTVKRIIHETMTWGEGSSDIVAAKLGMSRQTLHRKLKQHDVNYRTLLLEVRKEKALEYLYDDDLALDEISDRLGFKEPSSFFRAFKSWFGASPGQFRKSLLAEAEVGVC